MHRHGEPTQRAHVYAPAPRGRRASPPAPARPKAPPAGLPTALSAAAADDPESFCCAITGEAMTDPVIDPEGNTYERRAIEEWLALNPTSPITRTPLSVDQLVPNRALREAIEARGAAGLSIERPRRAAVPDVPAGVPAAPPAPLEVKVVAGATRGETDVLISIVPPAGTSRTPMDICCVIDISGSMGNDASIQNAAGDREGTGLCLLDIVKHAVRTIIETMKPADRIALVSFHTVAKIELPLTSMGATGKKRAIDALNALQPDDTTNIWDGLKTGLDVLREGESDTRLQSIVLLTDGKPNVVPPRGHLPMLKKYKDTNKTSCSINTFGFGYGLDSGLLAELAVEGDGMYVFIPDAGFVGTAFVNLTSNLLCTMAKNVILSLETTNGARFVSACGAVPAKPTSWGAEISLGCVQYGQTRDVVVRMNLAGGAPYLTATLTYQPHGMREPVAVSVDASDSRGSAELDVQVLRAAAVDGLLSIVSTKKRAGVEGGRRIARGVLDRILASPAHADRRVAALAQDFEGQVTEALSRDDWYAKWGEHYLPSLARAHQMQQCNNFKDPGVQVYGGVIFSSLRDIADDLFVNLPPPTPSHRDLVRPAPAVHHGRGASAAAPRAYSPPPVSMARFYDAMGGCFDGGCLVRMADGSQKAVRDVVAGDAVATLGKPAEVVCVVELAVPGGVASVVALPGGLVVTPWHPIRVDGRWLLPEEVGTISKRRCNSVFDFVLSGGHAVIVNGTPCVTLGHGATGDAREHAFWGTDAVVKALQGARGYADGHVSLPAGCWVRDPQTTLVCGLSLGN